MRYEIVVAQFIGLDESSNYNMIQSLAEMVSEYRRGVFSLVTSFNVIVCSSKDNT